LPLKLSPDFDAALISGVIKKACGEDFILECSVSGMEQAVAVARDDIPQQKDDTHQGMQSGML